MRLAPVVSTTFLSPLTNPARMIDLNQLSSRVVAVHSGFCRLWAFVFACGIVLLATGCGAERPSNLPPLFACEIAVIQDGAPLPGAQVLLSADDCKWSVTGVTDDLGVARMFTHEKFAGAPVGEYRATVFKEIVLEIPNPRHKPDVDNEPFFSKIYNAVDPAYHSEKATPARISVSANGPTQHQIDVGAAVPPPKVSSRGS